MSCHSNVLHETTCYTPKALVRLGLLNVVVCSTKTFIPQALHYYIYIYYLLHTTYTTIHTETQTVKNVVRFVVRSTQKLNAKKLNY